jgi:hypothetical protein
LLVIAAATAVIYIMQSPDRVEQRAVLEQTLPPLRDAITRGANAAKAAVSDAVSDATEHVAAAFPAQWQAGSGADGTPPAARERFRSPWRGPTPEPLRKLRTRIDAGQRGDEGMLAELRDYNREHPDDARGHLLLARLFVNRGAWNEMLTQYQLAFARDSSSRADPRMLQDLVHAVSHERSAARATELVRVVYGRDALDAVVRARVQARSPDERARLDRLTRVLSP